MRVCCLDKALLRQSVTITAHHYNGGRTSPIACDSGNCWWLCVKWALSNHLPVHYLHIKTAAENGKMFSFYFVYSHAMIYHHRVVHSDCILLTFPRRHLLRRKRISFYSETLHYHHRHILPYSIWQWCTVFSFPHHIYADLSVVQFPLINTEIFSYFTLHFLVVTETNERIFSCWLPVFPSWIWLSFFSFSTVLCIAMKANFAKKSGCLWRHFNYATEYVFGEWVPKIVHIWWWPPSSSSFISQFFFENGWCACCSPIKQISCVVLSYIFPCSTMNKCWIFSEKNQPNQT